MRVATAPLINALSLIPGDNSAAARWPMVWGCRLRFSARRKQLVGSEWADMIFTALPWGWQRSGRIAGYGRWNGW